MGINFFFNRQKDFRDNTIQSTKKVIIPNKYKLLIMGRNFTTKTNPIHIAINNMHRRIKYNCLISPDEAQQINP